MKKGFSFLCIISALLCFSLLSCKLKVEEEKEELVQKPDIDISNKQVTLIIQTIQPIALLMSLYLKMKNINTRHVTRIPKVSIIQTGQMKSKLTASMMPSLPVTT